MTCKMKQMSSGVLANLMDQWGLQNETDVKRSAGQPNRPMESGGNLQPVKNRGGQWIFNQLKTRVANGVLQKPYKIKRSAGQPNEPMESGRNLKPVKNQGGGR